MLIKYWNLYIFQLSIWRSYYHSVDYRLPPPFSCYISTTKITTKSIRHPLPFPWKDSTKYTRHDFIKWVVRTQSQTTTGGNLWLVKTDYVPQQNNYCKTIWRLKSQMAPEVQKTSGVDVSGLVIDLGCAVVINVAEGLVADDVHRHRTGRSLPPN